MHKMVDKMELNQKESWLSYLVNTISSNFIIDAKELGLQLNDATK